MFLCVFLHFFRFDFLEFIDGLIEITNEMKYSSMPSHFVQYLHLYPGKVLALVHNDKRKANRKDRACSGFSVRIS